MATVGAPLVVTTSMGTIARSDPGPMSYAQAIQKQKSFTSFNLSLRFPTEIGGEKGFIFLEHEMSKAAEDFRFTLVLKFLRSCPSINLIRTTIIKTWGLTKIPTMSFMDCFHVLIQMQNEKDFIHSWAREGRTLAGCYFHLFRWTKEFNLEKESSLALQWIFLPGLPLHLNRIDCLRIFATRFGRYLGTDNATINRSRAIGARICVEVDLNEEPVQGFPIVMASTKLWQEARYERQGFYCSKCSRQGHTAIVCRTGEIHKGRTAIVVKQVTRREFWRIKQNNPHIEASTKKTNDMLDHHGNNVDTLATAEVSKTRGTDASNLEKIDHDDKDEGEIRQEVDNLEDCLIDPIQKRLEFDTECDLNNEMNGKYVGIENNSGNEHTIEKDSEVMNIKGSKTDPGDTIQHSHPVLEAEVVTRILAEEVGMKLRESKLLMDGHAALVSEVLELENRIKPQSKDSVNIEAPTLLVSLSDGEEDIALRKLRKEQGYNSDMEVNLSKKLETKAVRTSQRVVSRPSKLNL